MGIRMVEQRVCDLHADYAEPVVSATVRLGDKIRDLDLCQEHADHLARWLDMDGEDLDLESSPVEPVGNVKPAPIKKPTKPAVKKVPPRVANGYAPARQVRAWAASQGIMVPSKGRVPVEIINQYLAATE